MAADETTAKGALLALIPLSAAGLGWLAKAVWGAIQQGRLDCLSERARLTVELSDARAELKAEQREHWRTAMLLERLSGKYERERGNSSSRPPR